MSAAPIVESPGTLPKNPIARVLSLRDFRLLLGGTATSILGDQFYLIATPWLVLQLTDDPLVLGLVIALGGIPRAIFMLIGGALTDRFSPRAILIASDLLRMIFTGLLAAAAFTGTVSLWMLYAISLGFGLVAGFAVPAGNSIVPLLVEERDLQAGNSVILGSTQLAGFVGPNSGRDSDRRAFEIDQRSRPGVHRRLAEFRRVRGRPAVDEHRAKRRA